MCMCVHTDYLIHQRRLLNSNAYIRYCVQLAWKLIKSNYQEQPAGPKRKETNFLFVFFSLCFYLSSFVREYLYGFLGYITCLNFIICWTLCQMLISLSCFLVFVIFLNRIYLVCLGLLQVSYNQLLHK